MSLKHLRSHANVQERDFLPKKLTPFERKRAAAITYEDLVELGYNEDMDFPESWAEYVLQGREKL